MYSNRFKYAGSSALLILATVLSACQASSSPEEEVAEQDRATDSPRDKGDHNDIVFTGANEGIVSYHGGYEDALFYQSF